MNTSERVRAFFVAGIAGLILACGRVATETPSSDDAGSFGDASASSSADGSVSSYDAGVQVSDAETPTDAAPSADTGTAPFDGGVACPPPPSQVVLPMHAPTSGSRLTMRVLGEVGGQGVPEDVLDSAFGVRCFPATYGDHTTRCVPDLPIYAQQGDYADAALTEPVVLLRTSTAPAQGAPLVLFGLPLACGTGSEVAGLGAQVGSTTFYDAKGVAHNVPAGEAIFDVTSFPIEPVVLQEVKTRLAGDIAVRELQGTDGSRLFAQNLYDTAHGAIVSVDTGLMRVLPPYAGWAGNLTPPTPDAGAYSQIKAAGFCDRDPVFTMPSGCGPSLGFVMSFGATYQVVPDTRTVFGCMTMPDAPVPYLQITTGPVLIGCNTLPFADWTVATPATVGARLTAKGAAIGGVVFVPPVRVARTPEILTGGSLNQLNASRDFFDTALGIDCTAWTSADDGVTRCMPRYGITVGYTDAACTQKVAVAAAAPDRLYATEVVQGGSGALQAYTIGAQVGTTHSFYGPNSISTCGLESYGAQNISLYAVTPVPGSSFAPMELRNLP